MFIEGAGIGAVAASATAAAQTTTSTPPVDLDATAPIRTETTTTPDGKIVALEFLHEDGDITVTRETTFGAGGNVTDQQIAFETSAGNDEITIDGSTSSGASVTVNGQEFTTSVPAKSADDFGPYSGITVRSGSGNDVIEVVKGSDINLTADGGFGADRIVGGEGDDRINGGFGADTLIGNGGRDDLFGASGNDSLSGGDGDDILYGGDGDDRLSGGQGNDYHEGGIGKDSVFGGAGSDILSGGRDADRLYGGTGNDTVYTGHGSDFVSNLAGDDTVYAQVGDDLITTASPFDHPAAAMNSSSNNVINVELNSKLGASSVIVEGSHDFVQRVEADIEFLRTSPVGQEVLGAFDQAFTDNGHTVTIRELSSEKNGFASADGGGGLDFLDSAGNPGATTSAQINYNPTFSTAFFEAPIVVLAHEAAHAFNIVTGTLQPGVYGGGFPGDPDTGIPNAERQAVGLDNDGVAFDGDNDPVTPASSDNPVAITENGLRREAGLPERPSYAVPPPFVPGPSGPF